MEFADGWCGALCEMRADLLEIVGMCGFKTWSNVLNPCFCCFATKDALFNFPASVESSSWMPKNVAEYNALVRQSLVKRIVKREVLVVLSGINR
jgi:hypothetical protein